MYHLLVRASDDSEFQVEQFSFRGIGIYIIDMTVMLWFLSLAHKGFCFSCVTISGPHVRYVLRQLLMSFAGNGD